MAGRTIKLTDAQRKMCEYASERTGVKRKNGCVTAKATQMVTVKYSDLTIAPVGMCDKCASKVKREAKKFGYTVESDRIKPISSLNG